MQAPAQRTASESLKPTALEIAAGTLLGEGPGEAVGEAVLAPRIALEEALLPAVRRPPCVVPFSGGRDSSLVLAASAAVARREGLALPVPITLRFPGVAAADESRWQERVLDHLRIREWEVVELDDELEIIGPIAAGILHEEGVLYPPNVHSQVPLAEHAHGGSILSGFGGDEVFLPGPWGTLRDIAGRRRPPRPGDLKRLGLAATPPRLREGVLRRRHPYPGPWLRPGARAEVTRLWVRDWFACPISWPAGVRWVARRRQVAAGRWALLRIAARAGAFGVVPLLEPRFVESLARAGRRWGWQDRTTLLTELFGDLLPRDVLAREDKGYYDRVYRGKRTFEFMRSWDGRGVDEELVDVGVLRSIWRGDHPSGATALLVQSAWLATGGG
jgi:asparagine synthase (glutamine-hydrolysing)